MQRFRKKALSFVLICALILSVSATAFADWTQYNGGNNHNGQITNGTPPISTNQTLTAAITMPGINGTPLTGIDVQPLMETVDGDTFAYVLYDGGAAAGTTGGARMAKVNVSTQTLVDDYSWDGGTQVNETGGFQLSTPYLAGDVIYVGVTDFYPRLLDSEFTGVPTGVWLPVGQTFTEIQTPDLNDDTDAKSSVLSLMNSGTVSQTFTFNGTATASQLTSAVILQQPYQTGSATVTYTITDITDNDVISDASYQITVSSLDPSDPSDTPEWAYLEKLTNKNKPLEVGHEYTVSAVVSGADVYIDYINFACSETGIKTVNKNTGVPTPLVGTGDVGQISTPITKYGNYLYFGTYNGGNKYYQYNLDPNPNIPATNRLKTFTGESNFYWAGAYSDGTTVYFGGDGGKLYYLPVANFGVTTGTSNTITLSSTAGNVRSSISTDGTYLYFTSQGTGTTGYLWKVAKAGLSASSSLDFVQLSGKSSSTPAISANDKIYVGYYKGFNEGGVEVVDKTDFDGTDNVFNEGPVQCSPIVYSVTTGQPSNRVDYIYFATNAAFGKGFLCSYTMAGVANTNLWGNGNGLGGTINPPGWRPGMPGAGHYSLQGFAADNGYAVYGDDGGELYIFH